MKKYQLGALTVSDKGLQDTKEEIVIELIDRMQKYVAEGKAAYENRDYTKEQKLNVIIQGLLYLSLRRRRRERRSI